MSWSFQIQNGDLALSGNSYASATGVQKLTQDLKCAIKTPLGVDDMHPDFGSVIDGGVTSDGVYHDSLIGGPNDRSSATAVESEISRVAKDYQLAQLYRSRSDGVQYGKTTLTPDEILVNLVGLSTRAVQDAMLVAAEIQTGAGSTVLNIPITSAS